MGKQFLPKMNFPFKSYDKKLVFFAKNGQLLSLPGTRKRKISFPIRTINFFETFCTCSPSSLGQDLTVKNVNKNIFKKYLGFLARNGSFECLLKKKAFVL
jgi:hypothetical protein